jgi:PII-like signaling protein
VVEIVDNESKLRYFVEQRLGDLHHIGLVTLERVEVLSLASTDEDR